jgi:NADPH2:quinone reductase
VALRSFRALRKGNSVTGDPGGRLVTMGAYNTLANGHKSMRAWLEWWPAMATTWLWGTLSSRRHVSGYRVQILRIPHQDWFAEDFQVLLELLRAGKVNPVVAERLPFTEARHAHELLDSSAAKGKLVLVP